MWHLLLLYRFAFVVLGLSFVLSSLLFSTLIFFYFPIDTEPENVSSCYQVSVGILYYILAIMAHTQTWVTEREKENTKN